MEKETATHYSILAWKIPWTRGAWQATVHGVAESPTWLKRLNIKPQVDSSSLGRGAETQLGLCAPVGTDLDSVCRETGEGASDLSINAHWGLCRLLRTQKWDALALRSQREGWPMLFGPNCIWASHRLCSHIWKNLLAQEKCMCFGYVFISDFMRQIFKYRKVEKIIQWKPISLHLGSTNFDIFAFSLLVLLDRWRDNR